MILTIAIFSGAILALLILSAFFSGSETALTATSRARMHELERNGIGRAGVVKALIQFPERFIGAILLGNNLVNILASALATALFVKLFGDVGVVVATFLMTALVLIFAEVLPKTYAISNSDRVALTVAPIIRVCVWLSRPLVRGVEFVVHHTLRLSGLKIGDASGLSAYDEVRGTIDLQHEEGAFIKDDRDMIGGILDLRELEVFDVMVHRTNMFTINIDDPSKQTIKAVLDSGYTRVPAWKDEQENIVGILHARDILAAVSQTKGDASKIDIPALCIPPWFVPETNSVTDQLKAFRQRKSHFALVVDEYGEVQGLVTMEDILEEIVGDITDEHDVEDAPGVRREASGGFIVDGTVPVRDLNRAMDWELPDEEVNTVAGLVIHEAQTIPRTGQVFTFYGFTFEVMERERNQITKLRIT